MPRYEALAEQPQGPQAKALMCEKSPMNKGKEIVFNNCMVPESKCNTYRKTLISSSGLYKNLRRFPIATCQGHLKLRPFPAEVKAGLK